MTQSRGQVATAASNAGQVVTAGPSGKLQAQSGGCMGTRNQRNSMTRAEMSDNCDRCNSKGLVSKAQEKGKTLYCCQDCCKQLGQAFNQCRPKCKVPIVTQVLSSVRCPGPKPAATGPRNDGSVSVPPRKVAQTVRGAPLTSAAQRAEPAPTLQVPPKLKAHVAQGHQNNTPQTAKKTHDPVNWNPKDAQAETQRRESKRLSASNHHLPANIRRQQEVKTLGVCAKGAQPKTEGAAAKPGVVSPRRFAGRSVGETQDAAICLVDSDEEAAPPPDVAVANTRQSNRLASKKGEVLRAVVKPSKGEGRGLEVTSLDLEKLEPNEFLNDTVIDFYIRHIQDKLEDSVRKRCHFFNTFFYKKLTQARSGKSMSPTSKTGHHYVRKWTKGVDIFAKDFIFIPIHDALHWSLIIVCFPGADPDSGQIPLILHLDSLQGGHTSTSLWTTLPDYLSAEWSRTSEIPGNVAHGWKASLNLEEGQQPPAKHFVRWNGNATKAEPSGLKPVPIKCKRVTHLPHQDNHCDCGLFLLSYIEFFTAALPDKLLIEDIESQGVSLSSYPHFLRKSWFAPKNTYVLRDHVRGLIASLLLNQAATDKKGTLVLNLEETVTKERLKESSVKRRCGLFYIPPEEYRQHVNCSRMGQSHRACKLYASVNGSSMPGDNVVVLDTSDVEEDRAPRRNRRSSTVHIDESDDAGTETAPPTMQSKRRRQTRGSDDEEPRKPSEPATPPRSRRRVSGVRGDQECKEVANGNLEERNRHTGKEGDQSSGLEDERTEDMELAACGGSGEIEEDDQSHESEDEESEDKDGAKEQDGQAAYDDRDMEETRNEMWQSEGDDADSSYSESSEEADEPMAVIEGVHVVRNGQDDADQEGGRKIDQEGDWTEEGSGAGEMLVGEEGMADEDALADEQGMADQTDMDDEQAMAGQHGMEEEQDMADKVAMAIEHTMGDEKGVKDEIRESVPDQGASRFAPKSVGRPDLPVTIDSKPAQRLFGTSLGGSPSGALDQAIIDEWEDGKTECKLNTRKVSIREQMAQDREDGERARGMLVHHAMASTPGAQDQVTLEGTHLPGNVSYLESADNVATDEDVRMGAMGLVHNVGVGSSQLEVPMAKSMGGNLPREMLRSEVREIEVVSDSMATDVISESIEAGTMGRRVVDAAKGDHGGGGDVDGHVLMGTPCSARAGRDVNGWTTSEGQVVGTGTGAQLSALSQDVPHEAHHLPVQLQQATTAQDPGDDHEHNAGQLRSDQLSREAIPGDMAEGEAGPARPRPVAGQARTKRLAVTFPRSTNRASSPPRTPDLSGDAEGTSGVAQTAVRMINGSRSSHQEPFLDTYSSLCADAGQAERQRGGEQQKRPSSAGHNRRNSAPNPATHAHKPVEIVAPLLNMPNVLNGINMNARSSDHSVGSLDIDGRQLGVSRDRRPPSNGHTADRRHSGAQTGYRGTDHERHPGQTSRTEWGDKNGRGRDPREQGRSLFPNENGMATGSREATPSRIRHYLVLNKPSSTLSHEQTIPREREGDSPLPSNGIRTSPRPTTGPGNDQAQQQQTMYEEPSVQSYGQVAPYACEGDDLIATNGQASGAPGPYPGPISHPQTKRLSLPGDTHHARPTPPPLPANSGMYNEGMLNSQHHSRGGLSDAREYDSRNHVPPDAREYDSCNHIPSEANLKPVALLPQFQLRNQHNSSSTNPLSYPAAHHVANRAHEIPPIQGAQHSQQHKVYAYPYREASNRSSSHTSQPHGSFYGAPPPHAQNHQQQHDCKNHENYNNYSASDMFSGSLGYQSSNIMKSTIAAEGPTPIWESKLAAVTARPGNASRPAWFQR